ncbi:MAG: peptide deformylase [Candidatus Saccharimonadales bacterium]
MKKEDIITMPNPHLRSRSQKISFISDDVKRLIADMESATLDWEASRPHEVGVALAAIQVDKLVRAVVVRNDFDNKQDNSFNILINPIITKYEGEQLEDFEGCLSIKDIYGKVKRFRKVRVKALNIHGKEIRITAEGFLARVLQHEIDHTNGIVFIDHIKDSPEAFFRLDKEGTLVPLDYEKDIKNNSILW